MHPEDKETDDQAVVVDDLAIDDGRNMIFFRWIKEAYAYMDNDTTCSTWSWWRIHLLSLCSASFVYRYYFKDKMKNHLYALLHLIHLFRSDCFTMNLWLWWWRTMILVAIVTWYYITSNIAMYDLIHVWHLWTMTACICWVTVWPWIWTFEKPSPHLAPNYLTSILPNTSPSLALHLALFSLLNDTKQHCVLFTFFVWKFYYLSCTSKIKK